MFCPLSMYNFYWEQKQTGWWGSSAHCRDGGTHAWSGLTRARGRATQRDLEPQRSHSHALKCCQSPSRSKKYQVSPVMPPISCQCLPGKNLTRSQLARESGDVVCRNQLPAPRSRAGVRQQQWEKWLSWTHCFITPFSHFQQGNLSMISMLP